MKLSEAIRRGARMRGESQVHTYWNGNSDTWGAALEGAGLVDWDTWTLGIFAEWRAGRMWPILRQIVKCPVCDKRASVDRMVGLHLHEGHYWGRLAIADWVATIESDEVPATTTPEPASAEGSAR